jgi:hypothetical protein
MLKHPLLRPSLVAALRLLLVPWGWNQTGPKKKVTSETDLPRFNYPVRGSASELVEADDATFNAFAAKVRADLDSVFRDYDLTDKSMLRTLLAAKVNLQELAGQYPEALSTVDAIRALQEKPARKLLSGLVAPAMLQAKIDSGGTSGPAFQQAFSRHYRDEVEPLPWDVAQDSIQATYASARLSSRADELSFVKDELDPTVEKSGALDNLQAWDLIAVRNDLNSGLELSPALAAVLKQYIASHHVVKPDMWAAREVTLTKDQRVTPVRVAIWDSGIDVSLYPDQLFPDTQPTASGTHGVAFDDHGNPSTTWLYPLTPEQQRRYLEIRDSLKGRLDIQNGVDSREADGLEKKLQTLSVDQLYELRQVEKGINFYIHGTHCAGIAVHGNPAARLVVARFNDQRPDLPFPPTPEWAHQLGAGVSADVRLLSHPQRPSCKHELG